MDVDLVYSYLIRACFFFLTSWALVLILACVVEFRREWSAPAGDPQVFRPPR